MKVIAIKKMSAGNAVVGEMWEEAKVFDSKEPLENVLKWAEVRQKQLILVINDEEGDLAEFEALKRPSDDDDLPF